MIRAMMRCTCGAVTGEKQCQCAKRRAQRALAMSLAVVLAGCSSSAPPPVLTKTVVERVTVPAGLLACEAEPAIGAYTLQSQVADYVVRLHEAWADCHEDLSAIAQLETAPPGK
jgi:hypothetical protein